MIYKRAIKLECVDLESITPKINSLTMNLFLTIDKSDNYLEETYFHPCI